MAPPPESQSLSRVLCRQRTLLARRSAPLGARALPRRHIGVAAEQDEREKSFLFSSSSSSLLLRRPSTTTTRAPISLQSSPDLPCSSTTTTSTSSSFSAAFWRESLELAGASAALVLLALSAAAPPAAAATAAAAVATADAAAVAYDPSGGEGLVKTVSGALYVGLVSFFLWRVLGRRARRARQERLAGQAPVETPFTALLRSVRDKRDAMRAGERARGEPGEAGPSDALLGAVQAGAIAAGLWFFTSKVEVAVAGSALPEQLTAHNVAVTVRTILLGLLYLVTFIFSANSVGLAALAVQMVVSPDSVPTDAEEAAETEARRRRREEARGGLPAVSVRSSPEELRAAFASAASKAKAEKEAGRGRREEEEAEGGSV